MKSFPSNQPMTVGELTEQVRLTLGDFLPEFDLEAIVAAIVGTYGVVPVDTIADDEYWALVRRFDISQPGADQTVEHNATGEFACTECGHLGRGQVPGCQCRGCDDDPPRSVRDVIGYP